MCFPKAPKTNKLAPAPEPEKAAEPLKVGEARAAEDEALFGTKDAPSLATNRDSLGKGIMASGTGLRM